MTENRESFFQRLEPFLAPSELLYVNLAYTLAKFGHRAQKRNELGEDGLPLRYFEHVRRVALILIDEAKIVRTEMIIAALLHDAIEDTRDITPAMIEHCFGADVTMLVKTLSKVPKEGYLERFTQCGDWRPYLLKACDRLDNLRSLGNASEAFRKKQLAETATKYFPLFERMMKLTPEVHRPQVESIVDLILETVEKLVSE